jgi:hypothetical protein
VRTDGKRKVAADMTKTPDEIKKGLECCVIGPSAHQPKCGECPYKLVNNCSDELLKNTAGLVKQLEAQVPRWISVEERLPEDREHVLMRIPGYDLHEGLYLTVTGFEYYDKATKPWAWKNVDGLVTHWMPMPKPPKEE